MKTWLCVAAFAVAGCAADSVIDELEGEIAGEDDGKADGAGAFTYWRATADGAGFRIVRANRTATECGNGVRGKSCAAASLELAGAELPEAVAKDALARIRAGESVLLRGELGDEAEAQTWERVSREAGERIASADLTAVASSTADVHFGDESGPDCLYGRLWLEDVDVAAAALTLAPDGAFTARLDGVALPATYEYATACVDGSSTMTVNIASLTAMGRLVVAEDGSVSLDAMTYAVTGVTYDAAGTPSQMVDILDGRIADVGPAVGAAITQALEPLLAANRHPRTLAVSEVWLPGSTTAAELAGVFVLATQTDEGVLERRLNSDRSATIDAMDLDAAEAAPASVETARAAMASGEGVLLVGYRYIDGGQRGRSAVQFWTRAK